MKKKFLAVSCLAFACMFAFGACGGGTTSDSVGGGNSNGGDSSGGASSNKNTIAAAQDLGADFNAAYYPSTDIECKVGKVDVAIVFDGTEAGWQALADEYSRLHKGAAVVVLDKKYTSATYPDRLNQELQTENSDWDIVQGNLAASGSMADYCVNMNSDVFLSNPYAGGSVWSEVLMEDAYISDKSGDNDTNTYLLNSEGLQTAWFVNAVAMDAAKANGYDKEGAPETWDELMSLCAAMEAAGYENPLGISVDTDSVNNAQFTWLLRVYGDLYYRSEYDNIAVDDSYTVDLEAEQPEASKSFKYSETKIFNLILGENISAGYVGGTSKKFQDFLKQFAKMKDYLRLDAATTSMEQLRAEFKTQSKGKSSPQILLDYAGVGLDFADEQNENFQMDFFDYPRMVSDYIAPNTLVRDVGGNGGYLSIKKHPNDAAQAGLNIDFLKFVLSPYGQTIYYKALSDNNIAPKGMTTVVNDLVVMPEAWKEFFETDKISFTGLVDSNPFISYFIRSLSGEQNSKTAATDLWKKFLTGTGSDAITEVQFGGAWHDALMLDWSIFCKKQGWNENCYKYPGQDVTYGG